MALDRIWIGKYVLSNIFLDEYGMGLAPMSTPVFPVPPQISDAMLTRRTVPEMIWHLAKVAVVRPEIGAKPIIRIGPRLLLDDLGFD